MDPVGQARRLSANPPLAALVFANGTSAIGDWLYLTVIPVLVYRETHDPALVGLVAAGRLLPWLLLSMPAGALTDRVSSRRLLLVSESTRAILMFLMTGLLLVGAPLWVVLATALGAVAAGTFAMPAQGTLIPELARDDSELGTANVLSSTLDNLACVVGPAIASLLMISGSIELAIVINGLSFAVVAGVLVGVVPSIGRHPLASDIPLEPIDARRRSQEWVQIARAAASPLAIDAAISFSAGVLCVLPVLIATSDPGRGEAFVGVLAAAAGVGGVLGAVTAGATVGDRSSRSILVGVIVAVASLTLLAWSAEALLAVAGVAMLAGAIVELDTINMTALQRTTASMRLGSTLGLLHTLAAAWIMAGAIVAGALVHLLGFGAAMVLCASVVAVLGAAALSWRQQEGRPMSPAPAEITAEIAAG